MSLSLALYHEFWKLLVRFVLSQSLKNLKLHFLDKMTLCSLFLLQGIRKCGLSLCNFVDNSTIMPLYWEEYWVSFFYYICLPYFLMRMISSALYFSHWPIDYWKKHNRRVWNRCNSKIIPNKWTSYWICLFFLFF